jgi:hypothetical protein
MAHQTTETLPIPPFEMRQLPEDLAPFGRVPHPVVSRDPSKIGR